MHHLWFGWSYKTNASLTYDKSRNRSIIMNFGQLWNHQSVTRVVMNKPWTRVQKLHFKNRAHALPPNTKNGSVINLSLKRYRTVCQRKPRGIHFQQLLTAAYSVLPTCRDPFITWFYSSIWTLDCLSFKLNPLLEERAVIYIYINHLT